MKVGYYFALDEFTQSPTADRLGIELHASADQINALKALCVFTLDPIRAWFDRPVLVTSGLRTPELNKAIGGSASSQHIIGEAADIKIEGLSSQDIVAGVRAMGILFDQCIAYAPERGGHVHISFTKRRDNRRQFLYAPANGGYRNLDTDIHRAQIKALGE